MTTFNDLNLDEKTLKAVLEAGYEKPTPIQEQAIPHAIMGKDVLGIAQTGTGKTASFTLPMITALSQGRARARMPRSLILCPTRELAAQVAENFEQYGKYHKLTMALLIGGVSFKDQDVKITRGVDVLIATPGRLLDHFERGKLLLNGVQIMVVDEADRMLDMGFIPDIERIFGLLPFTRQTLFFSATMAPEITRITETFLHNPVRVEVARQATTSDTITQKVCMFKASRKDRADSEKRKLLRQIIEDESKTGLTNGIVFCNRKRDVDIVAKSMKKYGLNAAPIHGDLDQSLRMKTLDGFRSGEVTFLVASDVAARGLDIPNVSHVFNYDVPIHSEDYVHRIGRTGRAGKTGTAIMICSAPDEKHLKAIEELVKMEIPRIDNPLKATSTPDAPAEDAKADEDAPKPRSRSRRRKPDPKPQDTADQPQKAAEPEQAKTPEKVAEPQAEQPKEERQPSRRRGGGGRSGGNSGRGNGGGGRDNRVVGMGDHVPAFLLRDLNPKAKKTETPADADADDGDQAA
ncbi:superfamily II DNA/RNA helicase [Rubricella aquisinus]|uniref:DEAD-box ATP-dependent RNA helicase RhpA n=1 Tax=Rubricella aquisinus TaxID=2028108 RepID=A0A840WZ53_9RHOB|nr:DEAD/DEAH box helicase [Rubricella aquisinus]MBB5515704.1 superfamily II DNA/RNA helicase [Rubricella aquisinus]